jgi:hypothetical protein
MLVLSSTLNEAIFLLSSTSCLKSSHNHSVSPKSSEMAELLYEITGFLLEKASSIEKQKASFELG